MVNKPFLYLEDMEHLMEETMSDHDQLCPCYGNPLPDFCECSPIAKARADERERIYQAIKADADARARAGRYGAGDLVAGLRVAQVIARNGGRDE